MLQCNEIELLDEFQWSPPLPGANIAAYVGDVDTFVRPELTHRMWAIGNATQWLQPHLRNKGVTLNCKKPRTLLPGSFGSEPLLRELRMLVDRGLTVAREGIRVVGVPAGPKDYQQHNAREFMGEEAVALVRELVALEGAQAIFQVTCLSVASKMSFLSRTLPHALTRRTAEDATR